MADLETPYIPAGMRPAHVEHEAHAQHLSRWPIITGLSAVVLAVGIAINLMVVVVGAVLVLFGLVGWVREDTLRFPLGPDPLTRHTQGEHDTGWWGLFLFLATEVVLFGSLFGVYFSARGSALEWPPHGVHLPVVLTGINTAILVSSGVVMHFGEVGLKRGNRKGFLVGFAGAILLGATFLVIQLSEYAKLTSEGVTLSSSIFGSSFYILTGTHGFHVFGGIVFLTIIFLRGLKGQFDEERHTAVTTGALYWHFVDVVWLVLFSIVYLQLI